MSKTELNPELLKAIVQVNDDYLRDDSILFQDESANTAEIFKVAKRFAIKRQTASECIAPKVLKSKHQKITYDPKSELGVYS